MNDIVGLYSPDNTTFPNYALMKLCQYHNEQGDATILLNNVSDYDKDTFDIVYCSSVFTFVDKIGLPPSWVTGGSGFSLSSELPNEVEMLEPDYSLYSDMDYALGFLTRGCIRACDFCIVHEKEGRIRPYRDVMTVAQGRTNIVLCDNNVLAHPHGLEQIEIIADKGFKVDFNQGLDARLITDDIARLLKRVKWLSPIRLACDDDDMIDIVVSAVERLRWFDVTPRQYFVYVLAYDVDSVMHRLKVMKGLYMRVFLQPYHDRNGTPVTRELRRLARWVNAGGGRAFRSCTWEDYREQRGDNL